MSMPVRMLLGGTRENRGGRPGRPGNGGCSARVFLVVVMVIMAYATYFGSTKSVENPFTGERQRILSNMTVKDEIAMGLASVGKMAEMHNGAHEGPLDDEIDRLGAKLLANVHDHPFQFEFHLLKDNKMVNAFALPGGQIFMTQALWNLLDETGRAGVLGHEIGHVLARHSAEQMAEALRNQGLAGAAAR